jgi:biopolymer transport protein ExbD
MEIGRDDFTVKAPVRSSLLVASPVTTPGYARVRTPRFLRPKAAPSNGTAVCDINTTPLIDVMLVLLVTLIMSLPLMTHAVKIDLPRGQPLDAAQPDVISLDLESDGTVVWDGTPVASFEQLDGYFRVAAQKTPQAEIHLRPERRVKYDVVARVLALAQHDRIQKIGFVDTGAYKD